MNIHLKNIKTKEDSIWLTKIVHDYQEKNFNPGKYRMASAVVYSNDYNKKACCIYRNKKSIVGEMIQY